MAKMPEDTCDQVVVRKGSGAAIERTPVKSPGPGEVLIKTVRNISLQYAFYHGISFPEDD